MKSYDCLVIGSGIAGSLTAIAMARAGIRTLVVESKTHPRFAIGESTVPATSLGLCALAETYDVPEFRQISHYLGLKEIGCAAWPKQSFWFGYHREGTPLAERDEVLVATLDLPIGPDVHVLRADVDSFLVSLFPKYGVDYLEHTEVSDIETSSTHVRVLLTSKTHGRSEMHAQYIIDCSGHASFLAERFGLRDPVPRLRTNTRTIFSHFEGVPMLEQLIDKKVEVFERSRDSGTMHHLFDGGWIWVIRFDTGVVSVGLVLDQDVYPNNDIPAEQEFFQIISRFPTVHAHLGAAKPIRPFVKTGRVQFTSRTIVGDRFILAPHAAGFIDALFSTGINLTQAFITRIVPALRSALDDGDFSPARFAPLDATFQSELQTIDTIVHGMMKSFCHFDMFKQYWRTWLLGTLIQYTSRVMCDPARTETPTHLFGASLMRWREQLDAAHAVTMQYRETDPVAGARILKTLLDTLPQPLDVGNWEVGSAAPCRPDFSSTFQMIDWIRQLKNMDPHFAEYTEMPRIVKFFRRASAESIDLLRKYWISKLRGTPYHKHVDLIRQHQMFARLRDKELRSRSPEEGLTWHNFLASNGQTAKPGASAVPRDALATANSH
jgi:tetracycline 7-halogenase / FADH2 O2-dependent halogenase